MSSRRDQPAEIGLSAFGTRPASLDWMYLPFRPRTIAVAGCPRIPDISRLSTVLLLNFDNTNGFQTAVAIASQSANPNAITAILLDSNGVQLATAPISLSAFGHSAFFLSNLLPQAANKAGSIRFESSAGVTGVGLRFSSTGTFTLVPTIR